MGHEHEATITELLVRISERGNIRTSVVDVKVVKDFSYGETVRVHLHKVRAHTGVRGNEVADAFAKHACRSPEDPQVRIAPGKGVVKRDISFWVTPVGGSRLDTGDIKGAVREHRQKLVHGEEKISDWVGIQDGSEKAKTDCAKAFWGSGTE
jgi:hypothetical protein